MNGTSAQAAAVPRISSRQIASITAGNALEFYDFVVYAIFAAQIGRAYGPWTVKSGLIQVEPPFEILERMVTLRVHLDAVDERNAPLRIVPGSHRLGRLPEAEIARVATISGERLCLAERGDVWLYATSIVHTSLAADPPRRRRVLQVDYLADAAPGSLAWRGV